MSATEAIARLRELRAKATPAPWSAKKEAFDDDEWERQYVYHAIPNGEMPVAFPLGGTREDANAAAIVAAMNSLPALLECASVLELLVGSIDAAQFEGLHDAIANEDRTHEGFVDATYPAPRARCPRRARRAGTNRREQCLI